MDQWAAYLTEERGTVRPPNARVTECDRDAARTPILVFLFPGICREQENKENSLFNYSHKAMGTGVREKRL